MKEKPKLPITFDKKLRILYLNVENVVFNNLYSIVLFLFLEFQN